jgi:hypothetical protein
MTTLGSSFDRLLDVVDEVGIVDKDLHRLRDAFGVEEQLRLLQGHEDQQGIIFRHADLVDGGDRIGFDARRGADGRHIAIGRNQRDQIAELQAEIFGHARADGHAFGGVKIVERALPQIAGDKGHLGEVGSAHALDHGASAPGAAWPLRHHLALDHWDGELDAVDLIDAISNRSIVVKLAVDRMQDDMAVDAQNAVQQFGAKAVHHRHDDNQRGDAEHDAQKRNDGDPGGDALLALGAQIAPGDHALKW